jgi:hypothetical protein
MASRFEVDDEPWDEIAPFIPVRQRRRWPQEVSEGVGAGDGRARPSLDDEGALI